MELTGVEPLVGWGCACKIFSDRHRSHRSQGSFSRFPACVATYVLASALGFRFLASCSIAAIRQHGGASNAMIFKRHFQSEHHPCPTLPNWLGSFASGQLGTYNRRTPWSIDSGCKRSFPYKLFCTWRIVRVLSHKGSVHLLRDDGFARQKGSDQHETLPMYEHPGYQVEIVVISEATARGVVFLPAVMTWSDVPVMVFWVCCANDQ